MSSIVTMFKAGNTFPVGHKIKLIKLEVNMKVAERGAFPLWMITLRFWKACVPANICSGAIRL